MTRLLKIIAIANIHRHLRNNKVAAGVSIYFYTEANRDSGTFSKWKLLARFV